MNRLQLVGLGLFTSILTTTLVIIQSPFEPFYQYFGWLIMFVSWVVEYTKVVLLPLGVFMQDLISRITPLFADTDLVYYIIFAVFVVLALVVNMRKPERTRRKQS